MKRLLRQLFAIDHLFITAIAILLIGILVQLTVNLSFLNPMARTIENFSLTDVFYDINRSVGDPDTSDVITLVDMTEIYDRARLADIFDSIQALEPAVVGVDIVFEGWRGDSTGTRRMRDAASRASSPTVFSYRLSDWEESEQEFRTSQRSIIFGPDFPPLQQIQEGYTNVHHSLNGSTVRSFSISRRAHGHIEHSMPAKVATTFMGDTTLYTQLSDQTIDFTATHFRVVHPDSLRQNADLIRSHIVLLGATADGLDMHFTPIGRMPGLEVLAYAVQTMLNQSNVTLLSSCQTFAFSVFVLWLVQLLQYLCTSYFNSRKGFLSQYIGQSDLPSSWVAITAMVILIGLCFWWFIHGVYINTMWALMGIALLDNARSLYKFCIVLLEHRFHWKWLQRSLYYTETNH